MNTNKELDRLIPLYYDCKERVEDEKKELDKINKDIKGILPVGEDYVVKDYVAKVSTQTRTEMNEEKMLEVIKNSCYLNEATNDYNIMLSGYPGLIKTKEYIDYDVLESLIYNGKLSVDTLQKLGECKSEKEIKTLRVTKK